MKKILVTPRSLTRDGHPSLEKTNKSEFEVIFSTPGVQPTENELLKLLPECVGYLAGVERVSAKVLEAAKVLKVISRNGVGINNIDLDAAKRLGVKVLATPGANSRGVAELAFSHILGIVRSISFSDSAMKDGRWERRKGIELAGKTLGLVGCGNIGKMVARFALAFDMKVIAYDVFKDESFMPSEEFNYCSFDDVLAESDIISLHCPPCENGTPLISAKAISKMKTGVYIVNTARAELLDEEAVLKGLNEGKIAGLTLDAFSPEPPDDWKLAQHEKVLATPHLGGFTQESIDRAVGQAIDNLLNTIA